MEEKIKDVYKVEKLKGNDSLVEWHNSVIEKTEPELTVADVARCIRQSIFVEVAYEMLIVYLLQDPYVGDMFPGELMEKASEVDNELILKHSNSLKEIINKAESFIEQKDWECDEDRDDFSESVEKIKEKVNI